jgi:regulator of cell morphogenesis and NO signaling
MVSEETNMQTIQEPTVAEIAANSLGAVRVFERLGIDYCCGGKRPLAEVCRQKGYDPNAVQRELQEAASATPEPAKDWNTAPLHELADHIVAKHHEYLKSEMPSIGARLEKVYRVYNHRRGDTLIGLPEVFSGLQDEMTSHMRKEEMVLFPAIVACEAAVKAGSNFPSLPFGSVANPIRMMESEHDSAGEAVAAIRKITNEYEIPDYACVTYRALITGLQELEQDLHLHVHLENNILFPRALDLEASQRKL